MDTYDRTRNQVAQSSTAAQSSYSSSFLTSNHYPAEASTRDIALENPHEKSDSNGPFTKGPPKRKRLAKACDACHKSKRRCDGTAPCSNCYYASKACTYTDSSGRPVPAPRPFKSGQIDTHPQPSDSRQTTAYTSPTQPPPIVSAIPDASRYSNSMRSQNTYLIPPSALPNEHGEDEQKLPRKRFRQDRANAMAVDDLAIDRISAMSIDLPMVDLDPSLTRELTNLFFTHCHPARAIIHKPTFAADLSRNSVPPYLLRAVCALAAPLSKQPKIRTSPSRFAGKPFAQEALAIMFDGSGRLVCEPNLATAQALCLLQMHDVLTKDKNMMWSSRYHGDLALQIVETLGVHSPEHPTLTPVPSADFIHRATEREAIRRIFWLIHLMDVMASIYFKKPISFTDNELRLRLPVDETSFELGVHSTLPEYLYLRAVRTQYASEFGHLIRILSIYAKVEFALDELNDPETHINPTAALKEAEQLMEEWAGSLPEHLRFSEQSLQVQQSMFETSSNTGAWSWCCMHVYHASCALALNVARQRAQRGPKSEPQWALSTLDSILNMLGDRAKNSILMGAALWSLIKYCKRDDAQVRQWSADYEEAWGTCMADLAQEWHAPAQPSPPLPHMYPPSNSSVSPSSSTAAASVSPQMPPQQQHSRRHSEARHPATAASTSRASPYALGRPLDELRLHNGGGGGPQTRADPPRGMSGPSPLIGAVSVLNGNGREKENSTGSPSSSGASHSPTLLSSSSAQSLPSLKASGLLDSWSSATSSTSRGSPRGSPPNGRVGSETQLQPSQAQMMQTQISTGIGMRGVGMQRAPQAYAMPVGLQWLANESR